MSNSFKKMFANQVGLESDVNVNVGDSAIAQDVEEVEMTEAEVELDEVDDAAEEVEETSEDMEAAEEAVETLESLKVAYEGALNSSGTVDSNVHVLARIGFKAAMAPFGAVSTDYVDSRVPSLESYNNDPFQTSTITLEAIGDTISKAGGAVKDGIKKFIAWVVDFTRKIIDFFDMQERRLKSLLAKAKQLTKTTQADDAKVKIGKPTRLMNATGGSDEINASSTEFKRMLKFSKNGENVIAKKTVLDELATLSTLSDKAASADNATFDQLTDLSKYTEKSTVIQRMQTLNTAYQKLEFPMFMAAKVTNNTGLSESFVKLVRLELTRERQGSTDIQFEALSKDEIIKVVNGALERHRPLRTAIRDLKDRRTKTYTDFASSLTGAYKEEGRTKIAQTSRSNQFVRDMVSFKIKTINYVQLVDKALYDYAASSYKLLAKGGDKKEEAAA